MQYITFCVNTAKNELEYIRLLFKSFEVNLSSPNHEIIVFVDSDNQQTTEWLVTQKIKFPNLKILKNKLPIPYGYQRNINEMFLFASNEIVSYIQSDMVICKNYDLEILKHIKPNMVLSSTRIEPPLHGNSGEKITYDFGLTPSEFKFDEFIKFSEHTKENKFSNYFFAPFTMYKEIWNSIGGHDTMFRRSREDSDILNRLILNGVEIVQTWEALVYHFTCTSSRGVDWFNPNNNEANERSKLQQKADSVELKRFIKKWGTFSHGNPLNYFYTINAKITIDDTNLNKLESIEPFFDKIYVSDYSIIYKKNNTHSYANTLLNINQNEWDKYSYLYNECNLNNYFTFDAMQGDVMIEFNLSDVNNNNFNNFISNLQHIIHQTSEVGEYQYENFKIIIKLKKNIINNMINVKNPSIKSEDLYVIYS
jgi:hypothetical protein